MATSGYIDKYVTKYDTLRFSWSRSSTSIAENYSTVSWSLQLIAGSYGAISSSASKAWSVNVNDQKYSGSNTVSIGNNTSKTLASGTTKIYHNNDGTKSFAYSFSQTFDIYFSGNVGTISGSSTGTLDSIPRKATITSAPDFNDEQNPTIYYSNPAGNSATSLAACISFTGNTVDISYRAISKTGNSYTFSLTAAEKAVLYKGTLSGSNSRNLYFYIRTELGNGNYYYHYVQKKFTIINCAPTLNPTVIDTGTVSTTLTGDPNKLILHYNTAKVAFNATALKGASISSMKVTCGNASRTSDGVMGYIESGTFVFSVTDNRGNTVSKTIAKDTIDYIPLTCNLSTDSDLIDGSTANMNLTVKGKYFAGSFGTVTNSLTVEYRYKTNDGNYPTDADGNEVWTSITGTPSNGEYTAQTTITGLNYTNSYTFQARAKDAVYTSGVSTPEQIIRILPVFDWGENDFNFNVPVHGARGFTYDIPVGNYDANTTLVSGKYYLGSTSTNRPIVKNGWLEVQSYDGGNYCYQKFIAYSGEEYERWRNDGVWGNWTTLGPHVLWSGGWHMNANQTITLPEKITEQKNGIALIFSAFTPSTNKVEDHTFSCHFVPKTFVKYTPGWGCNFNLSNSWGHGAKYLYIFDTSIKGNADNAVTKTVGNVSYSNSNYVLRYVIGM